MEKNQHSFWGVKSQELRYELDVLEYLEKLKVRGWGCEHLVELWTSLCIAGELDPEKTLPTQTIL